MGRTIATLTETVAGRPAVPPVEAALTSTELPQKPSVSVVIPALNEAENLPYVFARMPREELFDVILVDGNSIDDTATVARALYPTVRIVTQDGVGKGNALACGFAAARGEIIVTLDADGSTDPAEIPRYLDCLLSGAEFAKGSRFLEGGGSDDISFIRRAGNRFLMAVMNASFGTHYTDLCYGYNAFWTCLLPELNVDCDGFEVETLMNVRVAKAGLKVIEVPSMEGERLHGASNLRPVRDGCRVLRTIVRERFDWERTERVDTATARAPDVDLEAATVAVRS